MIDFEQHLSALLDDVAASIQPHPDPDSVFAPTVTPVPIHVHRFRPSFAAVAAAGIVLLGGDQWFRDRYWIAALIFTVIAFAIAFVFVRRGQAALSPANLAPDKTVASLKEDKEWLRQRLTSGGTSN